MAEILFYLVVGMVTGWFWTMWFYKKKTADTTRRIARLANDNVSLRTEADHWYLMYQDQINAKAQLISVEEKHLED